MTATQAPTPGPLSEPVKGAANGLCNRTACQAPLAGESQHQFMDGNFTGGPRLHYCAKCAADFDAWDYRCGDAIRIQREPKGLAPTAPVEASGSERDEKLKRAYEESAPFLEVIPDPTVEGCHRTVAHNPALRPQPSGETREQMMGGGDVIALVDQSRWDCPNAPQLSYANGWNDAVSARPLALGGQQGEKAYWPDIEDLAEKLVKETYRPGKIDGTGYLYTDVVGAVATGIAEERARHTTPARAEAQDEGAAGERDTSDAIELLVKAKDALQGHVAAIQAGKQASEIGRPLGQLNPILDCINGLPEIVRWLDAAQFDIEAAFEDYEDHAHPSPTPAADADKLRIAVEALERYAEQGYVGAQAALDKIGAPK